MKKVISALAVCFIPFLSQAQLNGGKVLLGGNMGITSSKITPKNNNGESSHSDFRFSPSLGLFLSDKTALGLFAEYQAVNVEQEISGSSNTITGMENVGKVGLFLRRYAMTGEKFAYFSQLDGGIVFGKSVRETVVFGSTNTEKKQSKLSGSSFGFSPGFAFFPSDRVGLELKWGRIGYDNFTITPLDAQDQAQTDLAEEGSNFTLNFGLSTVNVGLQFFLGKSGD